MADININDEDFEALVQLSQYAETELSNEKQRYVREFQRRIFEATESIGDFEFLLDGEDSSTSESLTVGMTRSELQAFRIAVDEAAQAEGLAPSPTSTDGEESDAPAWLVRLYDRASTWNPTHQADIETGLDLFGIHPVA